MIICPSIFHVFAVFLTLCLSHDHPDLCNENICFHIIVLFVHTYLLCCSDILPRRLFGFNGGKLRMDERIDLSMSDPDLVPLIIQVLYSFVFW